MHQADAGPGVIAQCAAAVGVELMLWMVPSQPPPAFEGLDGLLILGASADADQESEYPWLRAEKELIREALRDDLPTLGICLGGQLVAEAAGAELHRLAVSEIGWKTVDLTEAAAGDPLLGAGLRIPPVFQWHRCAFTTPPRATLLAIGASGPQAFRVGRAWGVQFHPEVTEPIVNGWIEDDGSGPEARAAGVRADVLQRETGSRIEASAALGRELFARFAALVSGGEA